MVLSPLIQETVEILIVSLDPSIHLGRRNCPGLPRAGYADAAPIALRPPAS